MKTRKTVRAFFTNIESLSVEDIAQLDTLKHLLSESVPGSIERAFKANQNFASVFEINMSEHYLEIPKSHWINALQTIITWHSHESVQDYEKCAELTKLIATIKEGKKKITRIPKSKLGGKE